MGRKVASVYHRHSNQTCACMRSITSERDHMHPMRASLFWARAVRAIDRSLDAAPNEQTPRAHLTQDTREPHRADTQETTRRWTDGDGGRAQRGGSTGTAHLGRKSMGEELRAIGHGLVAAPTDQTLRAHLTQATRESRRADTQESDNEAHGLEMRWQTERCSTKAPLMHSKLKASTSTCGQRTTSEPRVRRQHACAPYRA